MREADEVVVGRELPRIAAVRAEWPCRLVVRWANGTQAGRVEPIDVGSMLSAYTLFRPLRDDPALFETAHVTTFDSAVAWGEDDAIDLSAVALEEMASRAARRPGSAAA